jgi:CxxC motif-containing protein (DUF1111 family)
VAQSRSTVLVRPDAKLGLAVALTIATVALVLQAQHGTAPDATSLTARGARLFSARFGAPQGLGPLFNDVSCAECHNTPTIGGGGPAGLAPVLRIGRLADGAYDPLLARGGPVARAHSVAELGPTSCGAMAGVPAGANLTSVRNAPPLYGLGLIDAIPDDVMVAGERSSQGRPNLVDSRVGRFGWKADTPTLRQFVGDAFRNELGMTNPLAPFDLVVDPTCTTNSLDIDADAVNAVTLFIASLPAPTSKVGESRVFQDIGCATCHVPSLGGVPLYSDLLLHDMGRALDDAVVQGQARGVDWRTTPLWGLSGRARFLHDGRAHTIEAAILAHGGEAEPIAQRFRGLAPAERAALLAFLQTL